MTTSGTVTASILAGAVTDPTGNSSFASTSTDNTVDVVAMPSTIEVTTTSNVVDVEPSTILVAGLTTTPSSTNPDGLIGLREAIYAANNTVGADTIILQNATYTLALQDNILYGPNGLPPILSQILIEGNGAIIEREAAAPKLRFFYVSGGQGGLARGNLTLHSLALRGGLALGGNGAGGGGGGAGLGGAIFNAGDLTLFTVTAQANTAQGGNGSRGAADYGGGGGMAGDGVRLGSGGGPNGGINVGDDGGEGGGGAAGGGFGGFGGGGGAGTGSNGVQGGYGGFGGGGGGNVSGLVGPGNFGAGDGARNGFGNSARSLGGGGGGLGGAIFNRGGNVLITNSTLTNNTAIGGQGGGFVNETGNGGSGFGGAIFNLDGNVMLLNNTIAGNFVSAGAGDITNGSAEAGAIYNLQKTGAAVLTLTNCVLADSTAGNDAVNNGGTVSGTNNIIENSTEVPAEVIFTTADPMLGPLQDNGGLTPTMALLAGSPAIDAGTATDAPATDQRGLARFGAIDIGSFEVSFPWHNFAEPFDVRGGNSIVPDGEVDAGDALAVINYLNAFEDAKVPANAAPGQPFGFLDTTMDNNVAPDDALSIINAINADIAREAEAPTSQPDLQPLTSDFLSRSTDQALLSLLALDAASQSPRRRRG